MFLNCYNKTILLTCRPRKIIEIKTEHDDFIKIQVEKYYIYVRWLWKLCSWNKLSFSWTDLEQKFSTCVCLGISSDGKTFEHHVWSEVNIKILPRCKPWSHLIWNFILWKNCEPVLNSRKDFVNAINWVKNLRTVEKSKYWGKIFCSFITFKKRFSSEEA